MSTTTKSAVFSRDRWCRIMRLAHIGTAMQPKQNRHKFVSTPPRVRS